MDIIWDLPDDLKGNIQHIAEHDVTPEDGQEKVSGTFFEKVPDTFSSAPFLLRLFFCVAEIRSKPD